MADGKKSNNKLVAVLLVLVVGVAFALVPLNGRTGYEHVRGWLGAAPISAAPKNPAIQRVAPSSYSQEVVVEGRPRVDDGANQAQPLDDLTTKDRDALDKLIDKSRQK